MTFFAREGVGIKHLQQLAGHEVIASTLKYIQVTQEEVRAEMKKHPLALFKPTMTTDLERY